MPSKKDDPAEMLKAHEWLAYVSDCLDLPEGVERASIKQVLDLTKDVAHNRSRPAAPVTAFLVGLAAGIAAHPAAQDEPARLDEPPHVDKEKLLDVISEKMELIAHAARNEVNDGSEV